MINKIEYLYLIKKEKVSSICKEVNLSRSYVYNLLKKSGATNIKKSLYYRFWDKVNVKGLNNCWEWVAAKRNGYGAIKTNNEIDGAHRVSYRMFYGDIEEGMFICHKCDNPSCVNPQHLFEGTRSDNMLDASKKDRLYIPEGLKFEKGHKPKNRSLSDKVVKKIKDKINKGESTLVKISKEFGVKYQTIRDISVERSYKNI